MFCPNCKNEMVSQGNENVCPHCGMRVNTNLAHPEQPVKVDNLQPYNQPQYNQPQYNQPQYNQPPQQGRSDDKSSAGMGCLGFLFPIVGFILWLVWKNDYPLKAKSAGTGALISVVLGVIFGIIGAVVS